MYSPQIGQTQNAGEGLFLNRSAPLGAELFYEDPRFCLQQIGNRRFVSACAHCGAFCGGLSTQLETIFSDDEGAMTLVDVADFAAHWTTDKIPRDVVRCAHNCGEIYCSTACRDKAWGHSHNLLCVGALTLEHPLVQFKYFAVEHCETFLLAAQVFAYIVNQATNEESVRALMREMLGFSNALFPDVAPTSGEDRDAEFLQWTTEMMTDAFGLLRSGWEDLAQKPGFTIPVERFAPLFASTEFFSRVLAIFELNNHDVEIENPLKRFFQERVQQLLQAGAAGQPELQAILRLLQAKQVIMECLWTEEMTGNYDMSEDESDHDHVSDIDAIRQKVAAMPHEKLLATWPTYHANALIRSVAKMNHSCVPNVKVEFPTNSTKTLVRAVRPLKEGEELRICYIDENLPFASRQKRLREYGFNCACEKCVARV